jgi:hypothetical protein
MKSLANDLLTVVEGVLKDASLAYPDIRDFSKDLERLTRMVENRGLGVFTLDLPAMDAHLLDGLQDGFIDPHGHFSKRVSKKVKVPRFLRGLWMKIFDSSGSLRSDPDSTAIFFLRQIFCLGKKLEVGCSPQRLKDTMEEYHNVESATLHPILDWGGDRLDPHNRTESLDFTDLQAQYEWFGTGVGRGREDLPQLTDRSKRVDLLRRLQKNSDAFSEALGSFFPDSYVDSVNEWGKGIGLKHGPGAVSDRKGVYFKYDFTEWPEKLHRVFPFDEFGTIPGSGVDRPPNYETYSELIAVPKTAKGPRLIACEPTEHQWCQQAIKHFLEERIESLFGRNFISFKDQSLSQDMVRDGSRDGSLATVDLSSASDRLSCYVIERAFRRNKSLLRALHSVRTRWGKDSISSSSPLYFKYNKFASQGTAVTFPVQTIVFFLCAITACGIEAEGPEDFLVNKHFAKSRLRLFTNQVRVFGDDIIIPKNGYDSLLLLLHDLGLKVNEKKSFSRGLFRESCGSDCYGGFDVTPVKPRSLSATGPTLRAALVDTANNFFMKGLWYAAEAIRTIGKHRFWSMLPIAGPQSGLVGLKSFVGTQVDHLKNRWNAGLQRFDLLMWTFRSTSRRKPTNGLSGVLQYFTEEPAPDTNWEHGIQMRSKTSDGLRWESSFVARLN